MTAVCAREQRTYQVGNKPQAALKEESVNRCPLRGLEGEVCDRRCTTEPSAELIDGQLTLQNIDHKTVYSKKVE